MPAFEISLVVDPLEARVSNRLGPSDARRLVSSLVMICYLAILMSKRKFTKRTVATPDLDPASLPQQKMFERLRRRADRVLVLS
jgi:hypothetical protein